MRVSAAYVAAVTGELLRFRLAEITTICELHMWPELATPLDCKIACLEEAL